MIKSGLKTAYKSLRILEHVISHVWKRLPNLGVVQVRSHVPWDWSNEKKCLLGCRTWTEQSERRWEWWGLLIATGGFHVPEWKVLILLNYGICNIVTVWFGIEIGMLRRMKLENVNSADVRNSFDIYDRLISNEGPPVHVWITTILAPKGKVKAEVFVVWLSDLRGRRMTQGSNLSQAIVLDKLWNQQFPMGATKGWWIDTL